MKADKKPMKLEENQDLMKKKILRTKAFYQFEFKVIC